VIERFSAMRARDRSFSVLAKDGGDSLLISEMPACFIMIPMEDL
jgi:hypothetical protein